MSKGEVGYLQRKCTNHSISHGASTRRAPDIAWAPDGVCGVVDIPDKVVFLHEATQLSVNCAGG